jgi:hypothetical protein
MPANERMDWLVEKATELGVASIQPLMTERSVLRLSGERADKKVAHWHSVAIAACEQCGGNRVPAVSRLCKTLTSLAIRPWQCRATDPTAWACCHCRCKPVPCPTAHQRVVQCVRRCCHIVYLRPRRRLEPGIEEDLAVSKRQVSHRSPWVHAHCVRETADSWPHWRDWRCSPHSRSLRVAP